MISLSAGARRVAVELSQSDRLPSLFLAFNHRTGWIFWRNTPATALCAIFGGHNLGKQWVSMVRRFQSIACLSGIVLSLMVGAAQAANWKELGSEGASMDKSYIDLDGVTEIDGYRVVSVMTPYSTPTTNSHNITYDKMLYKTAVDCKNRQFSRIQTIAYLNNKQV